MLYDILVLGGGTAGVMAAVQAGREGSKTLLVEKSDRLGGTGVNAGINFPGLFHAWRKQVIAGIGWELVCRSMDEEKGLTAIGDALALIRAHRMGSTLSGATVMLNAATTLKCFGRAAESIPIFCHVSRVYSDKLDPSDYRFPGLYNNMALSYADVGDVKSAQRYFSLALKLIAALPDSFNDMAVTYCNMAEMYGRLDLEDARIESCMEKAWDCLNEPGLPRDGYHAFTISKCAPSFDYFGYFLYAKELKERAEKIYAGT